MATLTAYASSHNNAIPTGFNNQLTTPANAYGAPDATIATDAVAGLHTGGNHYYFSGLATIPALSTINSVTLTVRSRLTTTTRGDYFYRLDSAPDAQIATEWTPAKQATLADQSNSTWSTTPTLTQLKAATFGVRVRYARTATQAVTYELDSLAIVVDYTPPSYEVRVSFPTPTSAPGTGAGLQEFRALVRKKVNDANNPLVKLELWESGALKSTVLADTAVTSTTGQVVAGTWDASTLTTASGANVECKVVGTNVGGNAPEVGAIEWNKYPEDTATTTVTLTGVSSEESVGTLTAVPGVSTRSLTGLVTEESVGVLTPTPGVATLALTGVSSEESVGTLTPVAGVVTVTLTGLSSEESVGTLTASTATGIVLTGVVTEETVGTLTPVAGVATATLTGVSSEESVGALTPAPGVATLTLTGLSTEESVGTLTTAQILTTLVHVGFDTPSSQLVAGTSLQEFRVEVRKTVGTGTPSARIELWESGSYLATLLDNTDITEASPTSQVISVSWDAGLLSDISGEGVECQVVGSSDESFAGATAVVEVGAIEWNAFEVSPPQVLALTAVATEESVGSLTAAPGVVILTLAGLSSEESVGTLTLVPGAATAVLTGLSSEESVGTLTPVAGAVTAALTGLSSEESVGTLTAVPGVATRTLVGLVTEESAGTLTAVPGVATRTLTGLASEESVGTLTVTGAGVVGLVGVVSEESVGTLTAVAGAVTAGLTGVSTEESVGTLTTAPGVATRSLVGLSSEESVGTLTAIQGAQFVSLAGVASEEVPGIEYLVPTGTLVPSSAGTLVPSSAGAGLDYYGLIAVPGVATLALVGLSSEESVGVLTVAGAPQFRTLVGLSTEELVGVLTAAIYTNYVGYPRISVSIKPKIKASVSTVLKPRALLVVAEKPTATVTNAKLRARVSIAEKSRARVLVRQLV